MRFYKGFVLVLLPFVLFSLPGCGSSSSGGSFNPVSSPSGNTTTGGATFSNVSSATGKFGITLTTDRTTIDANIGQVLATATITDSTGAAVPGRGVTFSIQAGPATVTPSLTTVTTDSTGKAVTVIVPGDTLTTTNVIVKATTLISGQTATAYATFQIVRGTGEITFLTSASTTDPSGTLVTLSKTLDASQAGVPWEFMQQVPFQVTDANGNPRVGVPVTLSVDNQLTNRATITIINPTVTTDSNGKGIFNVGVTMTAPPQGLTYTDSIIYKAVTTETTPTPSLTTYGGFIVSMTTSVAPLTISPTTASFGTATDLTFTVSGGTKPYSVSSNNTGRVTATLQPDGTTVIAHLVDATAWTGTVTISATDSGGQTASATVSR